MKIGFYLEWMVGSLEESNKWNVVGEELIAMGWAKELKKIENQVYDSWSYIGIYKRYMRIGEDARAQKIITKGLKKNSHNPELIAVYSTYLLRHEKLDEAKKLSEELRGTKYGSIYSEAVMKVARRDSTDDSGAFWKDSKYYSIYLDAYRGSQNPIWIRNCALFNLKDGLFENAAALLPVAYADADDAVVKLRSLEALEKAADGQATKIIIPSELQNITATLAALKESVSSEKPNKKN